MSTTPFNPSEWVYVNDSMGRLGQGHYKKRDNSSATLSVSEFEKKRTKNSSNAQNIKEQNMNLYSALQRKPNSTPGTIPW